MADSGYKSAQFKKTAAKLNSDADRQLSNAATGLKTIDSLPYSFGSKDKTEIKIQRKNLTTDQKTFNVLWKNYLSKGGSNVSNIDLSYDNYCMSLAKLTVLNQRWSALLDVKMYKDANGWMKSLVKWQKDVKAQIKGIQKDIKYLEKLIKKLKKRNTRNNIETGLQTALDVALIAVDLANPSCIIITGLLRAGVSSAIALSADELLGPSAPDIMMDGSSTVLGVGAEIKSLAKYGKRLGYAGMAISLVDDLSEFGGDSKSVKELSKRLKQVSTRLAHLVKIHSKNTSKMFALEVRVRKNLKSMRAAYRKAEDAKKLYRLLLAEAPD